MREIKAFYFILSNTRTRDNKIEFLFENYIIIYFIINVQIPGRNRKKRREEELCQNK